MRVKTLPTVKRDLVYNKFPSFSTTGSVKGMKKLYYGENALLVRCGSFVYNVTSEPSIYYNEAH